MFDAVMPREVRLLQQLIASWARDLYHGTFFVKMFFPFTAREYLAAIHRASCINMRAFFVEMSEHLIVTHLC